MAVKEQDKLTLEELYNNYEFRVVKKILKDEFPWVKDVIIDKPERINNYNLLFVDLIIDPIELAEMYDDVGLAKYITGTTFFDHFSSPYLSTFFTSESGSIRGLQEKIDATLESIHNSRALPDHLKLPKARKLMAGSFIYNKPKKQ